MLAVFKLTSEALGAAAFWGFVLAAVLTLVQPRLCMVVMLVFTVIEVIWMLARPDRQSA
ncbi:MAG: hypothetical protein ACI361_08835 [Atopobiaceae bacterium]